MENDIFTVKSTGNDGPQALTMGDSLEKAIVVGLVQKKTLRYTR